MIEKRIFYHPTGDTPSVSLTLDSSPIGEPRVARGEVCGTRNTNQKTKANSYDLRADSPFYVGRKYSL